jgi:SlyX protein
MSDDIRILQEKIAFLERHVAEQDKAMLELTEEVARVRRELLQLRSQLGNRRAGEREVAPPDFGDERPPHY